MFWPMQTTKDYTCKLLLGTAWKVFLKKDFKTVFIREIIKIPSMQKLMSIVSRHREAFKILFSSIPGPHFNDYWEQWIDRIYGRGERDLS